jgi:hypothetical protein
MRGEILDMCLPPRAVGGRFVERKPALLHDEAGLAPIGSELGSDDGLIVLVLRQGHQEAPRRIAHVHPSRAFPATGEAGPELPAQPKVTFYLRDPVRQPLRVGKRRPQVIDVGVKDVFHADDGLAVNGSQRPHKAVAGSGAM